jgi:hypothetical protein
MQPIRTILVSATLAVVLAACGGAPADAPSGDAASPAAPASPPTANEAVSRLYGTWALALNQCTQQVLRISATRFEGAENGCDIREYADNGDLTFTASMSCAGEGQTVDEAIRMRPIFGPSGAGIELTYLNRDNFGTTVFRCPDPVEAAAD